MQVVWLINNLALHNAYNIFIIVGDLSAKIGLLYNV